MRLVVHDFSGHPFQVQLSRELAARGHEVLHLFSAGFETGKGHLSRLPQDPTSFAVEPVDAGLDFDKYSVFRRPLQEWRYGRRAAARIAEFEADLVISGNTPLLAQSVVQSAGRSSRARFVFWQQDVYSIGMTHVAIKRAGSLSRALRPGFEALERRLLHASDAVITISEDFVPTLLAWGLHSEKVTVIENWGPLDEITPLPRDNPWAVEHDLVGRSVILYAGTLGFKHDPSLLLALAERFRGDPGVCIVLVSEGPGAEWLARAREQRGLQNIKVLPRQPYERLPEILASGDILVAILDAGAGSFSVPSKVLSYHCAARPILASVPSSNLAARILHSHGSGLVVEPGDTPGLLTAAESLLSDPEQRAHMGQAGRKYAEQAFDISQVTDRFEAVIEQAIATPVRR